MSRCLELYIMPPYFVFLLLCDRDCISRSKFLASYRYYCSKPCQVLDWTHHKEYHKLLEKNRDEQGSVHDALSHSDASMVKSGTCSAEAKDGNSMETILRAASDQNWKEVKRLILCGADPSSADGQGLTALHYAAFYGSTKLSQILIEHGPSGLVFREAPGGTTSLFLACGNGHLDVAKILMEAGGKALLLKARTDGFSSLYIACQEGRLEVVKALIKAGGEELLFKTEGGGCSCLYSACQNGHLEIARSLIRRVGRHFFSRLM